MRTTVTIDDELLESARELSGVEEVPALVRLALQSYVRGEAARQLARMGGSAPDLQYTPRRRPPHFVNELPELTQEAPRPGRKGRQAAE
jgi:hypothetical protein